MLKKGNVMKRKDDRREMCYTHHYINASLYGRRLYEERAKQINSLSTHKNTHRIFKKRTSYLDEICLLWLKAKKPNVKESTYTRYVRTVEKHILTSFDDYRIDRINNSDIITVFNRMKLNLSDKTVADIRCVFKSIWNYGRENGYPCCELVFPKVKRQSTSKASSLPFYVLSKTIKILKQKNDLFALGILFTMFTGVRIGELCGLRWGDIDFENGFVIIRRTVERIADLDVNTNTKTKVILCDPKTESSKRIIPLPSSLIEHLKMFKNEDDRYILTASKKHTEPHTYYSRYKTFLFNAFWHMLDLRV